MGRRNRKIALIFTILIIVLMASGCGQKSSQEVEPEKMVPVKVALSQIEDLKEFQSFPGKVLAVDEVSLSAKIGGKVEQIFVEEGDTVKAGQVLIKLDQKDVISQLNQAQAGYEAALAQLSNLQNGQLPGQLASLKSALNQAEANFENAKEDYDRMKFLLDQGAISEQEFEKIKLQYDISKEQFEGAKTQLNLTEEKTAPESIAAAEAQVKQAEALLTAAQTTVDNCLITSPINGTVGAINVKTGQILNPGVSALTVGDLSSVEIQINVTEDKVNALSVGQEAEVTIDSVNTSPIIGEIVSISPFKDPRTHVYPVKVLVSNGDGSLKSGMFARVKLMVAKHSQVVTVPEDAVVSFDGMRIVYVLEEGLAKAYDVLTGPASKGKVVITKGVVAGKEIIVQGQDLLSDGAKVRVEGRGESQ